MKEKLMITVMMGLFFLSFLSTPTFAGIEPSPWHTQVNRLNSVVNGLDSINKRLDDVLRPPNPCRLRMPAPEGVMGRLEAMANQLEVLNDRIVAAMSGVPMELLPPEIEMPLMDIHDDAMIIAEMARMGFACPYNDSRVSESLMEVLNGAEMIIQTVNSFMPSIVPSLQ